MGDTVSECGSYSKNHQNLFDAIGGEIKSKLEELKNVTLKKGKFSLDISNSLIDGSFIEDGEHTSRDDDFYEGDKCLFGTELIDKLNLNLIFDKTYPVPGDDTVEPFEVVDLKNDGVYIGIGYADNIPFDQTMARDRTWYEFFSEDAGILLEVMTNNSENIDIDFDLRDIKGSTGDEKRARLADILHILRFLKDLPNRQDWDSKFKEEGYSDDEIYGTYGVLNTIESFRRSIVQFGHKIHSDERNDDFVPSTGPFFISEDDFKRVMDSNSSPKDSNPKLLKLVLRVEDKRGSSYRRSKLFEISRG